MCFIGNAELYNKDKWGFNHLIKQCMGSSNIWGEIAAVFGSGALRKDL